MLEVVRYNVLTPGALLPSEGRVVSCSRCGRPGVERMTKDGLVWVHSESLEMMTDGLVVVPEDYCPASDGPQGYPDVL